MDKTVTIFIAIAVYLIYLAVKFGIFYRYDKKFQERAAQEGSKRQSRRDRARKTDSDQSSSPF